MSLVLLMATAERARSIASIAAPMLADEDFRRRRARGFIARVDERERHIRRARLGATRREGASSNARQRTRSISTVRRDAAVGDPLSSSESPAPLFRLPGGA